MWEPSLSRRWAEERGFSMVTESFFQGWHAWVVLAVVLWIVEIFGTGFVLGIFGLGCLVAAFISAQDQPFAFQLLGFGLSSLVLFFTVRPFMLHHFHRHSPEKETNVDALTGKEGVVVERIDPERGEGRVKVGGEEWKASTSDRHVLEPGSPVVVDVVEGCTLYVTPLETNQTRT